MPKSICRSIEAAHGNLYFGFENCLAKFDFVEREMVAVPAFDKEWVYDIIKVLPSLMIIVTSNDWVGFNPEKNQKTPIEQIFKDTSASFKPFALTLHAETQYFDKKKAKVMYENLKQHLNSHFLF